jgi:fatty-acyl-CoA synthase
MSTWFQKMTIGSLPNRAAIKFGDREALYFKGNRWSFARLAEDVNRASKGLIRLGVQPGDKVGLWVPNRPEFIHLFFGLAKVGAVIVPINTFFRTSDTAYVLKQSNSSTLITVDQSGPINYLSMVREMLPSIQRAAEKELSSREFPDLKRVVIISEKSYNGTYSWSGVLTEGEAVSDQTLQQRCDSIDPDGTVFIMYTSGTTGFPKGVMHCHNVIRNIIDQSNRLAMTHQDVILMYLPLFHAFGLYEGPLMSMVSGAREVLTERFDPAESLALIEHEGVTMASGFDTHFRDMLEAREKDPKDVSSLRTGLLATGMSSSIPIARRFHREFCSGMVSAFGMSEIGVGACLSFLTSTEEQRCEASGFPSPGYEIKVIDPETGKEQPAGTPGEILIRGYMVMQGYYRKPEETAKTVDAEGWLHSGDMGLMREDGHLRFIGRFKEMLKIGGENVDPMEVEGFLLGHPAINHVAIVGYPDERLSEVGVAFVQLVPGKRLTKAEVIEFCKGKIATFKIPRHVVFVDDYPMTGSGKIQKIKLKEEALIKLGRPNDTKKS